MGRTASWLPLTRARTRRPEASAGVSPANVLPKVHHGRAMVDMVGLALLLGLLASGSMLMHSMEVTRSVPRVRAFAVLSIFFMLGFIYWYVEAL